MELSPYHFSDRLFFVAAAMLLNFLVAGRPWFQRLWATHQPARLLQWALRTLEHKLNRPHRRRTERTIRGAVMVLGALALCGLVAAALSALTAAHPLTWSLEVFVLALFLPFRQLHQQTFHLFELVQTKELSEARATAKRMTLRETTSLDAYALTRIGVESLAKAFCDRIVSPVFWYVFLGLPGLIGCRILTEAALLVGYPSTRHKAFGLVPARLEQAVTFVPAYLSGVLLSLAALFTPSANPAQALKTMHAEARRIHHPQKGWPMAAAAGSLGMTLGGPRSVQGFLVEDGWVGSGSAKTSIAHAKKFLLQYLIGCLLILIVVATLLLI